MAATPEAFFDLDDVRRMVSKWAVDCGGEVTKRREYLQWDRRKLAAVAGTTEATIQRIESGRLNPRDYLKLAIASALQVEVSDLWAYPTREQVYSNARAVA